MYSKTKVLSIGGIAFFAAIGAQVRGQEAVGTTANAPPTYEVAPGRGVQSTTTVPLNPLPDSGLHNVTQTEVSAEPRRFQYQLQITARGVYDDNINNSQSARVSDYYFTIEPTLTLGLGDIIGHQENYLRFDYAPSLFLFADHSDHDSVQQLIHVEGQHQFARLTLSLYEEVALLDGTDLRSLNDATAPGSHANLDVSGRNRFQTYTTHLNASYDLSGKTFLSSGVDSLVTEYDSTNLFSSATVSGNIFINYRYSEKIVAGIGGTAGYNVVDNPNPHQTFE